MVAFKHTQECQHDEYCSFAKSRCNKQSYMDSCGLKSADIDELPLLKMIKERVARDKQRLSNLVYT